MDLLFDLDGTLTDPQAGITRCIQHALVHLGLVAPPTKDLLRFIGPPLTKAFSELTGTEENGTVVQDAIRHYRERFSTVGLYENHVYPDVSDGLTTLHARGHRLWVATSKPEVFACRIVQHFELETVFQNIYGSELSGERADKATLVAHIIDREGLDRTQVWMIGDRGQDMAGGRANGTRTIGVLWGYGSENELKMADAEFLAGSMSAVISIIEAAVGNSPH